MQLQIPKNRITGSTFVYDPPLVRYNDTKKTYEEYESVQEIDYKESNRINDLFGDFS
jgi:hypothetical protein